MTTTKPTARKKVAKENAVPVTFPEFRAQKPLYKQGSTWAGVLSIGAIIATCGVSALTDPIILAQIASGIGLILTKEG